MTSAHKLRSKRRIPLFGTLPLLPSFGGIGGGSDIIGPFLSDLEVVSGEILVNCNLPATLYGVLTATATAPSGPQIAAGQDHLGAAAGFDFSFAVEDGANTDSPFSGVPAGTWYLHVVASNGALSNVLTLGETLVVSDGWVEDWSAYAVGNTFTELDAAYARTATTVVGTIVTNTDGPDGKALQFGLTSNAYQALRRDDIMTAMAARTTERIQVRCLWKLQATANARGGFGAVIAANSHTGIIIQRFSSTNHQVSVQVAGDPSTSTNATTLGSGFIDGALLWTLMEIDGNDIKGKVWLDGASEPGSWTTRTEGSAITVSNMGMTLRNGNPSHELLGYSVNVGADAAVF